MAVREFHGTILNKWENPVIRTNDGIEDGQWQGPFFPSEVPGAGRIETSHEGEWRSESDGLARGTAGWARWAARVEAFTEVPPEHFEWIQVNWNLPFLGKPDLTWSVSRIDPESGDDFSVVDKRPPILEIVPTKINDDDIPHDTALQVAEYFFTLPVSWFVHLIPSISQITVSFVVRQRAGTQSSALTFPTGLPDAEQLAMAAFQNRMRSATALGFIGGFPNFLESHVGRDHLAGTILVRSAGAEFHDLPLRQLGNVSLSDFAGRLRAANTWAAAQVSSEASGITPAGAPVFEHRFAGAFPTFFHSNSAGETVCGTIALTNEAAEMRKLSKAELGNFRDDDFAARFRLTQDYATKNGFVGGFPTFIDGRSLVGSTTLGGGSHFETLYGTVLLRTDHSILDRTDKFAARRNLLLFRDPA